MTTRQAASLPLFTRVYLVTDTGKRFDGFVMAQHETYLNVQWDGDNGIGTLGHDRCWQLREAETNHAAP